MALRKNEGGFLLLPCPAALRVDGVRRAHFLTAEAGDAAFGADDSFFLLNSDDPFRAGLGTMPAPDTVFQTYRREGTLATEKMVEKAVDGKEALPLDNRVRQQKRRRRRRKRIAFNNPLRGIA